MTEIRRRYRGPLALEVVYSANPNENVVITKLLKDDRATILRGGWPDLLCFEAGTATAIEIKGPRDVLSSTQRQVLKFLRDHNITVKVARVSFEGEITFEDVIEKPRRKKAIV